MDFPGFLQSNRSFLLLISSRDKKNSDFFIFYFADKTTFSLNLTEQSQSINQPLRYRGYCDVCFSSIWKELPPLKSCSCWQNVIGSTDSVFGQKPLLIVYRVARAWNAVTSGSNNKNATRLTGMLNGCLQRFESATHVDRQTDRPWPGEAASTLT